MHLTPEAPRSSIRALEDYSRTLGGLEPDEDAMEANTQWVKNKPSHSS